MTTNLSSNSNALEGAELDRPLLDKSERMKNSECSNYIYNSNGAIIAGMQKADEDLSDEYTFEGGNSMDIESSPQINETNQFEDPFENIKREQYITEEQSTF